jgi:hypothetical protein
LINKIVINNKSIMNRILVISSIIWIVLHYIIPHIYVKLCVPLSVFGFIESILISATPHCEALRYMLYISGNNIKYMWITIGTVIISFITNRLNTKVT